MSSMPTPREAALPSMAWSGSLSGRPARQSIGFEACLKRWEAASRKRLAIA